ncbi:MAG TPA: right-handed parallel beta-helix repeat-containing protein [Acidimicrobiales bacterium]|nr:right-handed parallel beta-helix repeat-containing protein [Acidimicrobiales bacterium]
MTHTRRALHAFALVLALTLSLVVVPEAGASGAVYEAPRNINSKGQKDVTDQLLKFFAGVPDGSTITFPAGARYRIEGILHIFDRHDLTFDGNGAEFFATTDGAEVAPPESDRTFALWPRGRRHWMIDNSERITLKNMKVQGANPNAGPWNGAYVSEYEAQHGIQFSRSSGLLEGVTVSDTYGDLVSVSEWSHDVTIRNSKLVRSGRQGITIDGATDVVIEGNTVGEIGRSLFDLEPSIANREVHRVRIANNQVGRANGAFIAALGRGRVNDVTVRDNKLTGVSMSAHVRAGRDPDGVRTRRANWVIIDNVSDKPSGSPQAMMRFWGVDGVTVSGNSQPIATTQSRKAVETWESCNVVATPNQWVPYTPVGKEPQPLIPLTTDGYETTAACAG